MLKQNDRKIRYVLISSQRVEECWRLDFIKELIDCKECFKSTDLGYVQVKEILDYLCIG